jgi:DNA-binding transcriptional MerR regulator
MTRDGLLTVHEVTARAGLTRKPLPLYEERGFVVPDRTDAGYRLYDEAALRRLELIRRARTLEMSTRELGEFLDIADGCCDREPNELVELVQDELAEADRRLAELAELRATLQDALSTLHEDADTRSAPRRTSARNRCARATRPPTRTGGEDDDRDPGGGHHGQHGVRLRLHVLRTAGPGRGAGADDRQRRRLRLRRLTGVGAAGSPAAPPHPPYAT